MLTIGQLLADQAELQIITESYFDAVDWSRGPVSGPKVEKILDAARRMVADDIEIQTFDLESLEGGFKGITAGVFKAMAAREPARHFQLPLTAALLADRFFVLVLDQLIHEAKNALVANFLNLRIKDLNEALEKYTDRRKSFKGCAEVEYIASLDEPCLPGVTHENLLPLDTQSFGLGEPRAN